MFLLFLLFMLLARLALTITHNLCCGGGVAKTAPHARDRAGRQRAARCLVPLLLPNMEASASVELAARSTESALDHRVLCPRGGRWVQEPSLKQPYDLHPGFAKTSMYRICPALNQTWAWRARDPACHAAASAESWCSVLAGHSLLFVGDSLSAQMFLSFLHLVANHTTELPAALQHADNDWKRLRAASLCGGSASAAFVRNDWVVDPAWNHRLLNESCRFSAAYSMMCRPFAYAHLRLEPRAHPTCSSLDVGPELTRDRQRAAAFDTLVLNTGLHNADIPRHGAALPKVAARTAALAAWLNTTRHRVIYRTSAPGHDGCEAAHAPLDRRYEPVAEHQHRWDDGSPVLGLNPTLVDQQIGRESSPHALGPRLGRSRAPRRAARGRARGGATRARPLH